MREKIREFQTKRINERKEKKKDETVSKQMRGSQVQIYSNP